MALPTLKVSERLRELLAYDKLAGAVPRVLILQGQYWVDGACLNAAVAHGWEARAVPVVMEGTLPREAFADLFQALAHFRPDFVLSVNLSGMDTDGMLARFLADVRMPHVTWFVDNPRTIVMDRPLYGSEWTVAATWDRHYAPYLLQVGFPAVFHLPLATDPALFDAEPAGAWIHPPSFVGDSNSVLAEREWAWVDERPALAAAVRRAFDEGRVTRESFAEGLGTLLPSEAGTLDAESRRHAEYVFFTEGTRRIRREFVQALEPEGIVVRGDRGWNGHFPRVGPPLDYASELPRFYRDCEVNLNVTSLQMPAAVNQRVFDCPAAGGFLLTDAQDEMEDLFEPGREAVVYRSWEECRDLLRFYRARPEARTEIVRQARRRILSEHTYAHRLGRIVSQVREIFCS